MKMKRQNPKSGKFDCFSKAFHLTVSAAEFLVVIKSYKHIRVGVLSGNTAPFDKTYFRVSKKEVQDILEFGNYIVTYSIMETPPELREQYEDKVFIDSLRCTLLLDDEKK